MHEECLREKKFDSDNDSASDVKTMHISIDTCPCFFDVIELPLPKIIPFLLMF